MRDEQQHTGDDQAALWNGVAGRTWVEARDLIDRLFKPFEDLLVETAVAGSARSVLDVGCGTGDTTLAIARALGPRGSSVGIDISEPMIAVARARAARDRLPATFLCADAQTHTFEPSSFDMIVSRFGVMFFGDPARAFANLRHAAKPGTGVLRAIAWRSPAENDFMTAAERAAAPLLPSMPPRRPDAPGQFAFADARRVRGILEHGGWVGIDVQPLDVVCSFPRSELLDYVTRLGPIGRLLHEADEHERARILAAVLPAFDPYVAGELIRFRAACWMIRATAAGA